MVRSLTYINQSYMPHMFSCSMTGRIDEQYFIGSGDRLGVNIQTGGMEVAEKGHLTGAVRIHGP